MRLRQYRRVYALLKRAGHSPAKSFEIVLDASRGDRFALDWIRVARRLGQWTN
jgi:hypothetical protein